MPTGIHLLLTYTCPFECDHCFLYSGPRASGTFTMEQIRRVLREAETLGTIEWIYFEGGEPFLYHPLLVEGARRARSLGFQVGVATNAYFAQTEEDAALWLRPLADLGVADLSVSDDGFHGDDRSAAPPKMALSAARSLGIPCATICIEKPAVDTPAVEDDRAGRLRCCPHEDLASRSRVHVDCYGHVHLCQGLSMGNRWKTPRRAPDYVDECHFCFEMGRALVGRFPEELAPLQVYGLDAPSWNASAP